MYLRNRQLPSPRYSWHVGSNTESGEVRPKHPTSSSDNQNLGTRSLSSANNLQPSLREGEVSTSNKTGGD